MGKSQQVKDLMLLEIGDSIDRAMEAMKSMSTYEDLKQARDRAEAEVELLHSTIKQLERDLTVKAANANAWKKEYDKLKEGAPTMPVIPKAVAIAIFREGMQHGVESACTELEGKTIEIDETGYTGGFEVSITKEIDLDDELDLDWMRGKVGDYDENFVLDCLSNLCAAEKFECRIHGVDDHQPFEPKPQYDG